MEDMKLFFERLNRKEFQAEVIEYPYYISEQEYEANMELLDNYALEREKAYQSLGDKYCK